MKITRAQTRLTGLGFGETLRWRNDLKGLPTGARRKSSPSISKVEAKCCATRPPQFPVALTRCPIPNKRCVRVREGGEVLQTLQFDRGCFACTLGGADKRTLFITAAEWHGFDRMFDGARTGQVLAVDAPAPGVGWP